MFNKIFPMVIDTFTKSVNLYYTEKNLTPFIQEIDKMTENEVFDAIAELIAERTDCDKAEIAMDSKFKDLGIDSLDTVDLLMSLEDKLDTTIELNQKIDTVGDLVSFIISK